MLCWFNSLTRVLSISDLRTVIVKFNIFFAIDILVSHKTSIKTRVGEFQIIQGLFVFRLWRNAMKTRRIVYKIRSSTGEIRRPKSETLIQIDLFKTYYTQFSRSTQDHSKVLAIFR
jgi:hypothetical protein